MQQRSLFGRKAFKQCMVQPTLSLQDCYFVAWQQITGEGACHSVRGICHLKQIFGTAWLPGTFFLVFAEHSRYVADSPFVEHSHFVERREYISHSLCRT